jgi:hypothetical protein
MNVSSRLGTKPARYWALTPTRILAVGILKPSASQVTKEYSSQQASLFMKSGRDGQSLQTVSSGIVKSGASESVGSSLLGPLR